jgi:pimeloyl-ACP methyl ester carboxylesterase
MASQIQAAPQATAGAARANYASIDDLRLYYEIHGAGEPLVLLHGGFMNIDAMGSLLPALAQSGQVIAVDLEGHGLHYTNMADDVAALLGQLGIEQADVFGFSMGGMTALRLAIRHPNVVRRLVVDSSPYNNAGYYSAIMAGLREICVAGMAGTPMEQGYQQIAPYPERRPAFVNKMREMVVIL